MAESTELLERRVAEEAGKITADSYQKVASLGGWSGGSRTFWAVSTLGTLVGAAIGLVAPFFPLLAVGITSATLEAAVSAIPASMAVFAATGMSFGFSSGAILGRISGSVATVAQEQEKRSKEWTVRQILSMNPNAEIVADAPKSPEPEKSLNQSIKDTYRTFVNPRVGAVMTAMGVVGGLILAAAYLYTEEPYFHVVKGALTVLTGVSAGTLKAVPAVVAAYTAGVMGTFGALWGLNFPKIVSETTHFFGELLNGKLLGREWAPEQQPVAAVAVTSKDIPAETKEIPVDAVEPQTARPRVTIRHHQSFAELVARPAESPEMLAKR